MDMASISSLWKKSIPTRQKQSGITLLLVILVLASLMTISIGIFNVAYTEIVISRELTSSFRALYAADQGIEYMLYHAFVTHPGWETDGTHPPCIDDGQSCSHGSPDSWTIGSGLICASAPA